MHLDKGKQNILRTFKFSKYGIVKIKQEYTLELRGDISTLTFIFSTQCWNSSAKYIGSHLLSSEELVERKLRMRNVIQYNTSKR